MFEQKKDLKLRDVWRTCNKIRAAIFRIGFDLWDYFRPLDPNHNGLISEAKFVAVLRGPLRHAVGFSDAEIGDLAEYFRDQDGRILYSQLCQVIHDSVPEFNSQPLVTGLEWEDPLEVNRLSYTELRKLNLILTQIAVNLNKRHLVLRPYFQDYELISKNSGTVTLAHFGRILHFLGIILAADEFRLLVKRFTKDSYTVNYVAFIQAIDEVQNYMEQHGMLSISGELLDQFPGRIITAELPKLPRPEIGRVSASEAFGRQSIFHPALEPTKEQMSLLEIIKRIQKHVFQRRIRVREFMQRYDVLNVGRITPSQFRRGLDALQVSFLGALYLSELEIKELVAFYTDPNDPERVLWRVFENDINHVFTGSELDELPNSRIESSPPLDIIEMPNRGQKPWQTVDSCQRDLCEDSLIKIRLRVEGRRIDIKQFFKNYDKLNHGYVSRNQMRQVLTTAGILLSPEEVFALEQRYNDELGFDYAWFLEDLQINSNTSTVNDETMFEEMRHLNPKKSKSIPQPYEKDIVQILGKIKAKIVRERIKIKDFLSQFDPRNEMVISRENFSRGIDQARCKLTSTEVETLMDVFKAPLRPGYVDYVRFSEAAEEAVGLRSLEKAPLLFPLQHVPSESCPRSFLNFDERQAVSQAMDKLAAVYRPNLEEIFKDFDKSNTGTVNKNQLMKTLSVRKMLSLLSTNELDALYKCFSIECNDSQLLMNYRDFLRALESVRENKKYLPF